MAKFVQQADIDAPMETVWAILADPNRWPLWFHEVESVQNLGSVQTGVTFRWNKGGDQGTGTVMRADPQDLLRIMMTTGGHESTHTFQLSPHGGILGVGGHGSHLKYTLEYKAMGGFLGELVAGGNPRDLLKAKDIVGNIKKLAEG